MERIMSEKFKVMLENVKQLNPQERALMAHIIISSLETVVDEEVDAAWGELANKRYDDLENGNVKPVTWDKIKQGIKG
jgi:putative addiction module component (TIGR02574 family)